MRRTWNEYDGGAIERRLSAAYLHKRYIHRTTPTESRLKLSSAALFHAVTEFSHHRPPPYALKTFPVEALARETLKLLAEISLPRNPWQTIEEHEARDVFCERMNNSRFLP